MTVLFYVFLVVMFELGLGMFVGRFLAIGSA